MINENVIRLPEAIIKQAAESFETPFFLYEEAQIRNNCRQFTSTFGKYFKNFTPLYAVKANPNPHVVRTIMEEGFGLDCSSPSELWLADQFNAFGMHTGNYLTEQELEDILNSDNILLNVDDISQLDTIERIGVPEFISFRINPNISKAGAGMDSNLLAGENAKFGIPWENAITAYTRAKAIGVKRFGIHMMTGSNVLDETYFIQITEKLLEVMEEVNQRTGIQFEYMNIGGGFGVPYEPQERSLDLEKVARGLRETMDNWVSRTGLTEPWLMVEPGRSIMADAGFLVTKVHVIKKSYKKFIGTDGGMNDLPRPAIYNAYHHVSVLNEVEYTNEEAVNIVGRLCENNDQFAKDRTLPIIEIGDVLVLHNAGAHAFAMGHNYNGRGRSAEYLAMTDGTIQQIRKAETIESLFSNIPEFNTVSI